MANTGRKVYTTLVEVDAETGLPTGNTKPNVSSDPDYIPPVDDLNTCPLPVTTTTTTTSTTTTTTSTSTTTTTTTLSGKRIRGHYHYESGAIDPIDVNILIDQFDPDLIVDDNQYILEPTQDEVSTWMDVTSSNRPLVGDLRIVNNLAGNEINYSYEFRDVSDNPIPGASSGTGIILPGEIFQSGTLLMGDASDDDVVLFIEFTTAP